MPFDPESKEYDIESARAANLSPDETGHWPSRVPSTGLLLKGRGHETWGKTVKGEKEAGYEIYEKNGRYYSRPMLFDPIKEGAVAAFDPETEGAVALKEPNRPPLSLPDAEDRAGKVWDDSVEYRVPAESIDEISVTPEYEEMKKSGFLESLKDEWADPIRAVKKIPIAGGLFGIGEMYSIHQAIGRLSNPEYDYEAEQKTKMPFARKVVLPTGWTEKQIVYHTAESDAEAVGKYLDYVLKDRTFMGKVAQGVSVLPTWMLEFAITGGLASIGKESTKKGITKLLGNYTKTKAGRIALRAASWTGGAITRASIGLSPRVVEKGFERQTQVKIGLREDEGWASSFFTAWGDVTIEAASEEAGQAITAGAGALMRTTKLGSKLAGGLQKAWTKITGGSASKFNKMLTAGGYSNILGEVGEERLATILRAITDIDDFGAGKNANVLERLAAGFQEDVAGFPVEVTVLSVPMAGQSIVNRLGMDKPKKIEISEPVPAIEGVEPTPEQVAKQKAVKAKKLTDKALTELGKAERPREIVEAEKTKELGKRVAKSARAAERAVGSKRLTSALGQLKGQLTEYKRPDFKPLSETMPVEEIDTLHDDIWERPHTDDHFSKLNTAQAWGKVVDGFIPTRGEITLLEKQWGKEFARTLLKKRPFGDRAWDTAADISNFMRTMLAGGDVSIAGRQLRVLGHKYPTEFGVSVGKGLGAYRSEKLAVIMREEYESSEYHTEAKKYVQFFDPAGLESTPPSERPEWYVSHYPEKVPIIGHLVRMGNRNYVETANHFTQSIWDKLRQQDERNGIEPTAEQLRLRGKWLMSMSGRPEIGGVIGRRVAPIAAGFFFAPRFAVSRFTSPMYLRHLASEDPVAREVGKQTAIAFASFVGTNIAILTLLKLTYGDGFEVELDPRSPDWGKGRIGDTRFDLWAGYQQAARFLVQMTLAQYKTQAGKVKDIERPEAIGRFIRGKENPLVSLISDLWAGKTYEGDRPFSPPKGEMGKRLDELQVPELIQGVGKEAYKRMVFMWVQDFADASMNDGWPIGITAGVSSFFGSNTASYEASPATKLALFKEDLAMTEHGKRWNELNSNQQKILSRVHKQVLFDMELQAKQEGLRRDDYDYVGRLIEDEKKAGKKVYKQLEPAHRKLLDEAGISLGLSRKIGDWEIDDKRYEQYQNFTAELLDVKLAKFAAIEGWKDIPIKRRVTKVELAVQIAKDKAKAKVRREARAEQ